MRTTAQKLHPSASRVNSISRSGVVARSFATLFDPPILLLDEPLAGLDDAGRELAAAIVRTHRRDGAVLLASNEARDFDSPDQRIDLPNSPSADASATGRGSEMVP